MENEAPNRRQPLRSRNPAFAARIAALRLTLWPIYPSHIAYGPPHAAFPPTMLHFHLLTEDNMDSFAHYYSQSTPNPTTTLYPAVMNWDKEFLAQPPVSPGEWDRTKEEWQLSTLDRISIKRRMVGKFIGLSGQETPAWEVRAKLTWLEKTFEARLEEEIQAAKESRKFA
jgi:hypothetical protein